MNAKAEQLYETMLQDMAYCRRKELSREKELECLFSISTRYWAILQHDVAVCEFKSLDEEIYFFKVIKPKFIAESVYCGLEGHAQLFKESTSDPAILEKFWKQESQRLEKFIFANTWFYDYYKAGESHRDHEWFTRLNSIDKNEFEQRTTSAQDHLVSQVLALERYMQFVDGELELISK